MAPPRDDEVQQAAGLAYHHDAGQHVGGRREHVIDGKQDLLGDKTDVVREIFQRVDRRSVDVGLARLAKTSVTGGQPESVEQAFQGCGSAVHRGGLHDLRGEPLRRAAALRRHVSVRGPAAATPRPVA